MAREEIDEQIRKKVSQLKEKGVELYPESVKKDFPVIEIISAFDSFAGKKVNLAGRIAAKREHGKITFCRLEDGDSAIQVIFSAQTQNPDFIAAIDLGDFISVFGEISYSKTNEKSINAESFVWASKTLNPLQKEHYKIADEEILVRRPYLGTLLYPEKKDLFRKRSAIISEIRNFFISERFVEVETPILQKNYGGTLAVPFKTHLNALDMDVYLRIAPEIYLKKMVVGGMERIFEIGKSFRNEGVDREHNPEFTTLEFYAAWENRDYLIDVTMRLVRRLTEKLYENPVFTFGKEKIDVSKKPEIVSFVDLLKKTSGLDYFSDTLDDFKKKIKELGIEANLKAATKGKLADEILKKKARPNMVQPTFLIDHPVDIAPLAKRNPKDQRLTLYMQFFMGASQLVTSYAELNDPIDQEGRFKDQQIMLKSGDAEAHPYDASFIEALEYGMPPTAGYGLGIDRLVMVLLNQQSLKDVIYFPFVR